MGGEMRRGVGVEGVEIIIRIYYKRKNNYLE